MKATRPLEYICFYPAEVPIKGGDAYIYLSIDAYSGFVFNKGVEDNNNIDTIIKHIYLLTEDKDFIKHMNIGFTLVLHKYQEHESRIKSIIEPLGGKLLFNEPYVAEIVLSVIKDMLSYDVDKVINLSITSLIML